MHSIALKIVGSSGQGIDSIGEIIAKALKRSGYCVFGYREYPSLIKGGHASYQLDISDEKIESSSTKVDLILALNHHGLENNIGDLKPEGIFLHITPNWKFQDHEKEMIEKLHLSIIELPIEKTLTELKAKPILGNVILTAFAWSLLEQDVESLKTMVGEKFAKKKDLLALNMECIDRGVAMRNEHSELSLRLPEAKKEWRNQLLLTGSKAMGLGSVAAGVRVYAGYPMTPSSPLLTYIAAIQNETGMSIKQAEDEITAAQFVSGAMLMGTRALTGTSGGGFDLMSETLSLNGIIENPSVFVLAQRPGPATGLPTWTGQGDLLMAIHTSHGDFARCVLSVSNAEDSFLLVNEAFNIAERYQISVIILTDKHIAEALYVTPPFEASNVTIDRGNLVQDAEELRTLKASDRYDPHAENGISKRWLPGTCAATFVSQGDEHSADGSVNESSENAIAQMTKRMKKMDALRTSLPEPDLFVKEKGENGTVVQKRNTEKIYPPKTPSENEEHRRIDILLIGWGSTKSAVLDVLNTTEFKKNGEPLTVAYLHFTYLWPLRTELLKDLLEKASMTILVEGNFTGQLGVLIKQETGIDIASKILKYDGRPFFRDELAKKIDAVINE